MPVRTFDFCALQFLNQWLEKEAKYCEFLNQDSQEDQRNALIQAGAHFRVARNLPTEYESSRNLPRYQPVLDVLHRAPQVTPENVVEVVSDVQRDISVQYGGRNVLSLTSKFLWLKFKSPVRIYDRQARIALGTAEGDFQAFNAAFSLRFTQCASEIESACQNLKSLAPYTVSPNMSGSEIDSLAKSPWFMERVLDIYLWNQGNT